MKKLIAISLLGVIAVFSGCGDSATEITGTLPIVTGISIDTLTTTGDTVVVTWTALDTTLVDGYFLWTRPTIEGNWTLAMATDRNVGVHIANKSAFYGVMAFSGSDNSADMSMTVNTKTQILSEIREEFTLRPIGFRVDVDGDSLIAGDPTSPEFAQHFIVAVNWIGERYIFRGTAHPELWPGGSRTLISTSYGFLAPAPDDTVSWSDSISFGDDFFIRLDNNYYGMLKGTHTLPDTASMTDTLVIRGQIQPIMGLRLFSDL